MEAEGEQFFKLPTGRRNRVEVVRSSAQGCAKAVQLGSSKAQELTQ